MEERLLVIMPPLPARRIIQCLVKRGAQFVDRDVESELEIRINVLLHRLGECSKQITIMSGR